MYFIDIDISAHGICESDERGWRGASAIVAEGENLAEILEDARMFWCDQDGGECLETEVDSPWMVQLIINEYASQYDRRLRELETQGVDRESI